MTVEEAIRIATDTVKNLFAGSDHRLEEVEYLDNGSFHVTISYHAPDAPRAVAIQQDAGLAAVYTGRKAAIGVDATRTYKDVVVAADGQVKRVTMRQIVVG